MYNLPKLLSTFEELGQLIRCQLEELARLRRALESEYGRYPDDIQPHTPLKMPLVRDVTLAQNEVQDISLAAGLGKSATRGNVVNTGSFELKVIFEGPDGERSNPYPLLPGAALDFSSFLPAKLTVSSPYGAGRLAVLAQ